MDRMVRNSDSADNDNDPAHAAKNVQTSISKFMTWHHYHLFAYIG